MTFAEIIYRISNSRLGLEAIYVSITKIDDIRFDGYMLSYGATIKLKKVTIHKGTEQLLLDLQVFHHIHDQRKIVLCQLRDINALTYDTQSWEKGHSDCVQAWFFPPVAL